MSVYKIPNKTNKWKIDVIKGYDGKGKPIRVLKTYTGLKSEAKAVEAKIKSELKANTYTEVNKHTFSSFSKEWLDKYSKTYLAPKTHEEYKRLISIINKKIGYYKLQSITPLVLIDFYSSLKKKNGEEFSRNSIRRYYDVIGSCLTRAAQWGYISANPNKKVPKPKPERHEADFYNSEEVMELLECVSHENIQKRLLIHLALDTGARRGEIAGLQWSKVNLEDRILKIDLTRQRVRGRGVIEKEPKTYGSIREVQFTEATYNLFIKLKEEQQREKRKMGNQWNNNDFIFKTQFGYPIDPSRASQLFYEVTKKHDLRHIPFHGLRHTSVSLLLANGVNTHAVSKRVGHSNVSTTQEIYAHLFKSVEQEAVNMMNNILR